LQGESLEASLTVRDLDTSVAWYTEVLGFTIDRKHERGGKPIAVSLRAGAVRILLTQDDGAKGLDRAKGGGFSLQITTPGSVDTLAARIERKGGTLDNAPTTAPWGVRFIRIKDPDGFRFTISTTQTA
jgi:uncharacterized glyoxalase superfamily protein PhnB